MSYTVVGLFPTNEMADHASNKLDSAGFAKEDYRVSKYTRTGKVEKDVDNDYDEDEKTSGFWDWLFGDNDQDKKRFSYAGTKSNVVTVYTDDLDRAEKAREIMNAEGALDVNDFTKERYSTEEFVAPQSNDLSNQEKARIINKAKNDLYFTDDRSYTIRSRRDGMENDMDSLGSENP